MEGAKQVLGVNDPRAELSHGKLPGGLEVSGGAADALAR